MRILITGASGFIGLHLLSKLVLTNHQILVISRNQSFLRSMPDNNNLIGILADLNSLDNVRHSFKFFDPQIVCHLAWQGIPNFSDENCKLNLENSINLCDIITKSKSCQKVIMSGTCAEYGKINGKCLESDEIQINTTFAWAKYTLYQYAKLKLQERNVSFFWFRLFYVYGPGQRRSALIPSLTTSILNNQVPSINSPENCNDFVYVDDVIDAIVTCIETQSSRSGLYNIGSGIPTKIKKVYTEVANSLDKDYCNKIISKRQEQNLVNFWADISKIRKHLNWVPTTSLSDGIRKYHRTITE